LQLQDLLKSHTPELRVKMRATLSAQAVMKSPSKIREKMKANEMEHTE